LRGRIGIVLLLISWTAMVHAVSPEAAKPWHLQIATPDERAWGHSENSGVGIFQAACAQCHGKVPAAPTVATLRRMSTEKVYEALTTGVMKTQAMAYSSEQKRLVAEWLGGRRLEAGLKGDAQDMPNRCIDRVTINNLDAGAWNGWGRDLANTRYQPAASAGLSPASVRQLKLRWAFAFPGATSVYGQPTVVGHTVIVSADSGYVYALDAATGCVHWSFRAAAGVRSAVVVGHPSIGHLNFVAYFGDVRGNVYAIDAMNGKPIWQVAVDTHALARITGAAKLYKDRLYVPVASLEEPEASDRTYQCCTFRGSVVALDAVSGRVIWKTYTIAQPSERRTTPGGAGYWGPSGASVWDSPTVDPPRNALYIGTGNGFSGPPTAESDAVMALDLGSGNIIWSKQFLADDIALHDCTVTEVDARNHCLKPFGPDQDIAASVIVGQSAAGRQIAIVGQKSVGVWAYNPDDNGKLLWYQSLMARYGMPGLGGEIVFGGATDGENVYFALTGTQAAGLFALELTTGSWKWFRTLPPARSRKNHPGISAAVSVIPGVVFTGGLDGLLHAFSTVDGSTLWTFDTIQKMKTVNGVSGKGGSIGSAGPVIAGGMVFANSGYIGFQNGIPGNLLLAFSP